MSSTVFSLQNPSPIETRRTPIKNNDNENNRRSLSGKFRNLFRKNSSSPNNDRRPPPAQIRQTSSSPAQGRTSTEAPHLRAPIINWPFGKKKTKSTTATTTKTKGSKKTKKTTGSSIEISNPIYEQEHQTSIHGQNFIPRTPELTHGALGGTQSTSSYETTAKGFRDYTIIDNTKSSQQGILTDIDVITPPPYSSDRSRSPSLNDQRLPDTRIEHSYYHDSSPPPISEIEIIPIPKQQHLVGDTSSLTTTQILAGKTPILPSTVTQPTNVTTNSNQWKNTSYSSLNNTELRSTTSSSMDVDIPKLNAPLVPVGSTSSSKKSKQTNSQSRNDDTYNSSSTITNFNQQNRSHTNTYASLPDANSMHNENFTSLKPIKSNIAKYPGLSAIIEHHIRPTSVNFNERPPISTTASPKQTIRFDTSTETVNDYNQQQQWYTNIINGSPPSPSIHHHDGYIRPLTPQKPSIQPDVSMIPVDLDHLRGQSPPRTKHYNLSDSPVMYRSSTTIYTRDKHNYASGGELRTWSIQENNDINRNLKPSTSIQILPSKTTNDYQYHSKINEEENAYEYERQRQPQYLNNINNSNFTRPTIINERDKIYDQSTRSYNDNEYTQEPFNTITPVENSEVALRHCTLKRTNSYDGLGILISADSETRLNHRIRDIEIGSPGSRSGLRKNDRIINVNGINVENVEFGNVLILIKQGLKNNNLQFSVTNDSMII